MSSEARSESHGDATNVKSGHGLTGPPPASLALLPSEPHRSQVSIPHTKESDDAGESLGSGQG